MVLAVIKSDGGADPVLVLYQVGAAGPVRDCVVQCHSGPGFGLQHGVAHAHAHPDFIGRAPLSELHQIPMLAGLEEHIHQHTAGGGNEKIVHAVAEHRGLHPLRHGIDLLLELILIPHLLPLPDEQILLIVKNIVEVDADNSQLPLVLPGREVLNLQVIDLLADDLLRRIGSNAGNSLRQQWVPNVLHAGKAGGNQATLITVPVKILELLLKADLLRAVRRPVELRALDAGRLQRFPQEFRIIPVHADSPQITAVDGHGLQKRLESRRAAVGQIAPGDRLLHPAHGIGVVGGAGEQNGVYVLPLLQFFRNHSGFFVKFRVTVGNLYIRNVSFRYSLDNF